MFRREFWLRAVQYDFLWQPTLLPFGSGVSASFHQLHITGLTVVHLVNPSGLPLGPYPNLGFAIRTVHALLTRGSLLTSRAGGVRDSLMWRQRTEHPWEVLFFHSCNLLFHVAQVDYVAPV